jgi:hypothetical protein
MTSRLFTALAMIFLMGTAIAIDFDRSGNGIPDIRIDSSQVLIDNDEDGIFDHGFLDSNSDSQLDSVWVDRNDDGIIKGGEVKKTRIEVVFTPLLNTTNISVEIRNHTDAIRYYIDYNGDGRPDEIAVDTDKDGDIEVDAFGAYDAVGIFTLSGMQLMDFDNDGDFEEGRFQSNIGDPKIKTVRFSKSLQTQLMTYIME